MTTGPLVSIVIPVWNQADQVFRCLKSLEQQTYQPREVIMVDDGSTDGLASRITQYASHIRVPIQFHRFEQNKGAPAARNEGARHAKGEYIIFLDADIVMEPTFLEKMVQVLETHPEAAFVYSAHYFGWKMFPCYPFDVERLKKMNYIHTSSLMRRSIFPEFDESLKRFQDWDLWLTLAKQGMKGIWIPEPLFRIRTGGSMSRWMPKVFYKIKWPILGYTPRQMIRYHDAKEIIKKKHGL